MYINFLAYLCAEKVIIYNSIMVKKHLLSRLVILLAALSCSVNMQAQRHPTASKENTLQFIVGAQDALNDSVNSPYDILMENTPIDPDFSTPHFAIVDKDRLYYFSVGATVKAVTSFDFGNPYKNETDFKVSDFSYADPGNGALWQMSMKSSTVSFNFVALPKHKYRIGAFVALGFGGGVGNDYRITCDHAYLKFGGLTVGYTSSIYDDNSADAYIVDGNGPGASGSHSNMIIGFQRYLNPHIKIGVGLELPDVSYTYGNPELEDLEINQRVPDIPLYFQYSWANIGHLRLSGVLRTMTYRDVVADKNRTELGYGLKLTSNLKAGNFVGYFMTQAGQGIASYLKDNDEYLLDLTPSVDEPGRLNRTKSWGGLWALQYNFTPKLFSTAMYGYMRNYVDPYDQGTKAWGEHMKYEQYGALNLIWKAGSYINFGIEYNYGIKHTFAGDAIHNNRIAGMIRATF